MLRRQVKQSIIFVRDTNRFKKGDQLKIAGDVLANGNCRQGLQYHMALSLKSPS